MVSSKSETCTRRVLLTRQYYLLVVKPPPANGEAALGVSLGENNNAEQLELDVVVSEMVAGGGYGSVNDSPDHDDHNEDDESYDDSAYFSQFAANDMNKLFGKPNIEQPAAVPGDGELVKDLELEDHLLHVPELPYTLDLDGELDLGIWEECSS